MARELEVWVDREACISNASCVMIAPEHFETDEDNRSHATHSPAEENDQLWEAVRGCPVQAIHAADADTGEELYPPG